MILKWLIGSAIGCMIYIFAKYLIKSILIIFDKNNMDEAVKIMSEDERFRKYGEENIRLYIDRTIKALIAICFVVLPLLIMLFIWVIR